MPPASHPPKTRHFSGRSKEILSVDLTPSSSSTSQDSTASESHTVSSPYSSDDQVKDAYLAARPEKRSSIHLVTIPTDDHTSKRTRCDSLVIPVEHKIESPMQNPIGVVTHVSRTCELDQLAMPPPRPPVSLWPIVHDHASSQTMLCSTLQATLINSYAGNPWCDGAFDFQSYDQYTLGIQHKGSVGISHSNAGVSTTEGRTPNLDFMPLSRIS